MNPEINEYLDMHVRDLIKIHGENTISLAYEFARLAHYNQFRLDGKTQYFEHLVAVAHKCYKLWPNDPEQNHIACVAYLHDLLEDQSDTVYAKRLPFAFSARIVKAVNAITHPKSEPYDDYIKRVCQNDIAAKVKLADMLHNLSDDPRQDRVKKYARAIEQLIIHFNTKKTNAS
jgi:(p)ppGpp synthase/HD superfamily hydrolase